MAIELNISRSNPLVRIPRTWIDDLYPKPIKILKLIREVDGDRIILIPLVDESIEAAINSNRNKEGDQTNDSKEPNQKNGAKNESKR